MTSTSTIKTFSLSSCDWIGFDLDHTLIRYRLIELHTLIYELLCQYLVDTYQYNSHLLKIPYDNYFGVKALIYDSLYGNLIQLDSNGLVHTALHGVNTRLSSQNIKEFYPNALENIEEDTTVVIHRTSAILSVTNFVLIKLSALKTFYFSIFFSIRSVLVYTLV